MGQDSFNTRWRAFQPGKDFGPPACETGLMLLRGWQIRITRLSASAPIFVYALVFVLVETAYIAFERTAFSQANESDIIPRARRITNVRSYLAFGMFSAAAAISFWSPLTGFALICCVLLIYLSPHLPNLCYPRRKGARSHRPA
jgi:hypothetical protein